MPTTVKVDLSHEVFCLPPAARGTGEETEPRVEQYRSTGVEVVDGKDRERILLVTRCIECGVVRYTTPN